MLMPAADREATRRSQPLPQPLICSWSPKTRWTRQMTRCTCLIRGRAACAYGQVGVVHRAGGYPSFVEEHSVLEGEDVIPGFAVPLCDRFVSGGASRAQV